MCLKQFSVLPSEKFSYEVGYKHKGSNKLIFLVKWSAEIFYNSSYKFTTPNRICWGGKMF